MPAALPARGTPGVEWAPVDFSSPEAELAFLRGLTSVYRVADEILEDCLERGLDLEAATDAYLSHCLRLLHASAGFISLRGTQGPVLTRVLGPLGIDVHEAARWQGSRPLGDQRVLFCYPLALGKLEFGGMGLIVTGHFDAATEQHIATLVEAMAEQFDTAVLSFLALQERRSPLERLDELARVDPFEPRGRIGRYEIVKTLGSGGMAQVLVARTTGPEGLGRLVALKRILPQLASEPPLVQQFLDEARIGLRLNHPNLVTVHDFGEVQGTYYIAMELVRGVDLLKLLRSGPVPPSIVSCILIQALHGLQAAHTLLGEDGAPLQLVHRDLSPSNLMVCFDGRVRVLDFGVAKARAQRTETLPGIVKGKPLYMSPEQARGQPLDARSDLFSMGLILFEALTGIHPFDRGSELASMQAIVQEALSQPLGVQDPLWRVLEVALAKQPQARYAHAQAMAEALAQACPPARESEVARLMVLRFPERQRELQQLDRALLARRTRTQEALPAQQGQPGKP